MADANHPNSSSYLDANNATNPNSAVGNAGAAMLIADMNDTRAGLAAMNLPKTLPVGTADAGAYFNTLVMENMAFGMANVHPWFGDVPIDQAAEWTWNFFETTNVAAAAALPNKPPMYIAETGWPTVRLLTPLQLAASTVLIYHDLSQLRLQRCKDGQPRRRLRGSLPPGHDSEFGRFFLQNLAVKQ